MGAEPWSFVRRSWLWSVCASHKNWISISQHPMQFYWLRRRFMSRERILYS